MIHRHAEAEIREHLDTFPALAILGPRQVGKTTLALELAKSTPSVYLDLESPEDRAIAGDPRQFLASVGDKLVILDEIQRMPALFTVLRGLIDQGRREGRKAGQFLLLGSASGDLLRQSSESLAGRIIYHELTPLTVDEAPSEVPELWLRGGFPESLLARSNRTSLTWRRSFLTQYLERELPLLGVRTARETLHRLWSMLASSQAGAFHPAQIASSLGISPHTISTHIDMLCDLMLVRRLKPWFANTGKRLIRTPKVWFRDSGLTHALLGIETYEDLLRHPALGGSWEAFVAEQLIAAAGPSVQPWFYRTSNGAEVDLLLEFSQGEIWAIEIRHGSAPTPSRGFYTACQDVKARRTMIVHGGTRSYQQGEIEFRTLRDLTSELRAISRSGA